ncbi:MAG TPA: nucleoside monophosphate kinase [Candidatus Binatia bacterium]|nr:nucleoside monophosphate kinase [Candidatus Binatia bacterium]
MRLVVFGAPGAGKGTQVARIRDDLQAVSIATGDLLRIAARDGSEAGRQAQALMAKGKLVPDEVVGEIVRDRLAQTDARLGWVLDGFPRTLPQLALLERLLAKAKTPPDRWLLIDVPEDVIAERVLGRRTCRQCQTSWHVKFNPSPAGDRCGRCGGELYQRLDDSPENLETRLATFRRDTVPVLQRLRARGVLTEVRADGRSPDEVELLVRATLGLPQPVQVY